MPRLLTPSPSPKLSLLLNLVYTTLDFLFDSQILQFRYTLDCAALLWVKSEETIFYQRTLVYECFCMEIRHPQDCPFFYTASGPTGNHKMGQSSVCTCIHLTNNTDLWTQHSRRLGHKRCLLTNLPTLRCSHCSLLTLGPDSAVLRNCCAIFVIK